VRRSQEHKKDSQVISQFTLLGSVHAKSAREMMVKLTPVVNFTNSLAKSADAPGQVV